MSVIGAEEVATALVVVGRETDAGVRKLLGTFGFRLLSGVKGRASRARTSPSVAGLGPRVQSGDYLRGIGIIFGSNGAGADFASVGTNKVQGHRLEVGYDDGVHRTLPHPHFGPAFDLQAPKFEVAMGELVAAGWDAT